jgi:TolB-like protein
MIYRFGDFALDTDSLALTRDGAAVDVEPQVFSLLACLIENRERVVSKDELIEMVWDGRIVSDGTLNTRINSVRRAVGDDGKRQAVIKTFPRRGFRFVAELAGGGEKKSAMPETAALGKPSIAVLPFDYLSGDADQDYIGDGLTEDIITRLSHIRSILVIARNSTYQFKGTSPDIRQVAKVLGVLYVLEGSVQKSADRIRISAQLIDGETGNHLWAERYDRALNDLFALQDELTLTIVAQLEPELGRAEYDRVRTKPPENLDAWGLYHRGLTHIFRRNKEDILEGRQLFERAIKLDPNFAGGHAGVAWTFCQDAFFGTDETGLQRAL